MLDYGNERSQRVELARNAAHWSAGSFLHKDTTGPHLRRFRHSEPTVERMPNEPFTIMKLPFHLFHEITQSSFLMVCIVLAAANLPIVSSISRQLLFSEKLLYRKRYAPLLYRSVSRTAMAEENNLVISLRNHLLPVDSLKRGTGDSQKIRLILASQSPRRREILDMMGLQNLFETIPSPLDEDSLAASLQKDDPIEYTRHLAEQKALALANSISMSNSTLVLGSDTIVAYSNKILEKPVDQKDAIRMLKELQGNQHMVHTGVALVDGTTLVDSFTVTANVRFAELSDADIEAYVNTGEPMDKSGAYGIQGIGGQIVESIDGDFFAVMGLPMRRTSQALARAITTILSRRSDQS